MAQFLQVEQGKFSPTNSVCSSRTLLGVSDAQLQEYGPVMYLSLAGQSLIVLSTHQAAQDLLNRRGSTYSDRPRMVMAGEVVTKGLQFLFHDYDEEYKRRQRGGQPILNARASKSYVPLQELESQQLLYDRIHEFDK
jgi:cytochrome P450